MDLRRARGSARLPTAEGCGTPRPVVPGPPERRRFGYASQAGFPQPGELEPHKSSAEPSESGRSRLWCRPTTPQRCQRQHGSLARSAPNPQAVRIDATTPRSRRVSPSAGRRRSFGGGQSRRNGSPPPGAAAQLCNESAASPTILNQPSVTVLSFVAEHARRSQTSHRHAILVRPLGGGRWSAARKSSRGPSTSAEPAGSLASQWAAKQPRRLFLDHARGPFLPRLTGELRDLDARRQPVRSRSTRSTPAFRAEACSTTQHEVRYLRSS